MKVGTKSLLVGVHQFLWHPYTVVRAWRLLYDEWPSWRVFICIFCHDLGYWGCPDMDGPCGLRHPFRGAQLASNLLWRTAPDEPGHNTWFSFTACHSRKYAEFVRDVPSRLCWADKCSVLFEPRWFYLLRARLSGELSEYRAEAAASGKCAAQHSDRLWFWALQSEVRSTVHQHAVDGIRVCFRFP